MPFFYGYVCRKQPLNEKTMANTYGQAYVHVVFAVKYRAAMLEKPWRAELFAYMGGILNNMQHNCVIIKVAA
jgi:hypothetical protein